MTVRSLQFAGYCLMLATWVMTLSAFDRHPLRSYTASMGVVGAFSLFVVVSSLDAGLYAVNVLILASCFQVVATLFLVYSVRVLLRLNGTAATLGFHNQRQAASVRFLVAATSVTVVVALVRAALFFWVPVARSPPTDSIQAAAYPWFFYQVPETVIGLLILASVVHPASERRVFWDPGQGFDAASSARKGPLAASEPDIELAPLHADDSPASHPVGPGLPDALTLLLESTEAPRKYAALASALRGQHAASSSSAAATGAAPNGVGSHGADARLRAAADAADTLSRALSSGPWLRWEGAQVSVTELYMRTTMGAGMVPVLLRGRTVMVVVSVCRRSLRAAVNAWLRRATPPEAHVSRAPDGSAVRLRCAGAGSFATEQARLHPSGVQESDVPVEERLGQQPRNNTGAAAPRFVPLDHHLVEDLDSFDGPRDTEWAEVGRTEPVSDWAGPGPACFCVAPLLCVPEGGDVLVRVEVVALQEQRPNPDAKASSVTLLGRAHCTVRQLVHGIDGAEGEAQGKESSSPAASPVVSAKAAGSGRIRQAGHVSGASAGVGAGTGAGAGAEPRRRAGGGTTTSAAAAATATATATVDADSLVLRLHARVPQRHTCIPSFVLLRRTSLPLPGSELRARAAARALQVASLANAAVSLRAAAGDVDLWRQYASDECRERGVGIDGRTGGFGAQATGAPLLLHNVRAALRARVGGANRATRSSTQGGPLGAGDDGDGSSASSADEAGEGGGVSFVGSIVSRFRHGASRHGASRQRARDGSPPREGAAGAAARQGSPIGGGGRAPGSVGSSLAALAHWARNASQAGGPGDDPRPDDTLDLVLHLQVSQDEQHRRVAAAAAALVDAMQRPASSSHHVRAFVLPCVEVGPVSAWSRRRNIGRLFAVEECVESPYAFALPAAWLQLRSRHARAVAACLRDALARGAGTGSAGADAESLLEDGGAAQHDDPGPRRVRTLGRLPWGLGKRKATGTAFVFGSTGEGGSGAGADAAEELFAPSLPHSASAPRLQQDGARPPPPLKPAGVDRARFLALLGLRSTPPSEALLRGLHLLATNYAGLARTLAGSERWLKRSNERMRGLLAHVPTNLHTYSLTVCRGRDVDHLATLLAGAVASELQQLSGPRAFALKETEASTRSASLRLRPGYFRFPQVPTDGECPCPASKALDASLRRELGQLAATLCSDDNVVITLGAPAAHTFRFRRGGLRQQQLRALATRSGARSPVGAAETVGPSPPAVSSLRSIGSNYSRRVTGVSIKGLRESESASGAFAPNASVTSAAGGGAATSRDGVAGDGMTQEEAEHHTARFDAAFSQALSGAVTAVAAHVRRLAAVHAPFLAADSMGGDSKGSGAARGAGAGQVRQMLERRTDLRQRCAEVDSFWQAAAECGLCLQWESLLSTSGKELGMLGDTVAAVEAIGDVRIAFKCSGAGFTGRKRAGGGKGGHLPGSMVTGLHEHPSDVGASVFESGAGSKRPATRAPRRSSVILPASMRRAPKSAPVESQVNPLVDSLSLPCDPIDAAGGAAAPKREEGRGQDTGGDTAARDGAGASAVVRRVARSLEAGGGEVFVRREQAMLAKGGGGGGGAGAGAGESGRLQSLRLTDKSVVPPVATRNHAGSVSGRTQGAQNAAGGASASRDVGDSTGLVAAASAVHRQEQEAPARSPTLAAAAAMARRARLARARWPRLQKVEATVVPGHSARGGSSLRAASQWGISGKDRGQKLLRAALAREEGEEEEEEARTGAWTSRIASSRGSLPPFPISSAPGTWSELTPAPTSWEAARVLTACRRVPASEAGGPGAAASGAASASAGRGGTGSRHDTVLVVTLELAADEFALLPASLREGGATLCLVPVLFTQGINEQQTYANAVGGDALQHTINSRAVLAMGEYVSSWVRYARGRASGLQAGSGAASGGAGAGASGGSGPVRSGARHFSFDNAYECQFKQQQVRARSAGRQAGGGAPVPLADQCLTRNPVV